MLNYIATEETSKLIKRISENQNILILYETKETTDIKKYLKETKVNFNLIKFFIIELKCLDNSENDIIETISNFNRLYLKTRIIILAQGFNNQSKILNELYDKEIYNIINSTDETEIEKEIIKALSENGITKREAKKFEKLEEVKQPKDNKFNKFKELIKQKGIKDRKKKKEIKDINIQLPKTMEKEQIIHQSGGVYFFAILLEAMTRLVKLICYIAVFLLTSIGITILLNSQLREMIFQILS